MGNNFTIQSTLCQEIYRLAHGSTKLTGIRALIRICWKNFTRSAGSQCHRVLKPPGRGIVFRQQSVRCLLTLKEIPS
jgi:hypothetical protein